MSTTKAQRSALAKARAQGQFIPVNPVLEFKRSTSRGRNTYGYNNGIKVASTCGGGYDMKGTVLGDYIQQRFQAELLGYHLSSMRTHGKGRDIYILAKD